MLPVALVDSEKALVLTGHFNLFWGFIETCTFVLQLFQEVWFYLLVIIF